VPISNDELLRTESPAFDFQFQFFAGGKWEHLDSSAILAGQPYTPTAQTTLTEDVTKETTTLKVESTAGFGTGGLCIQPGAEGTQYELVRYTGKTATTFTGLTRGFVYLDNQTPESGEHAAGDVVSEWVDITPWVMGSLTISQQRKEQIGTWTASMGGLGYNSRVLEQGNAILCLWRFRPANGDLGTWTDWTVAFIGYIRSARADDDDTMKRAWTATVEGLEQYLAKSESYGHQLGRVDLAAGKSVQTSTVLGDPWEERFSGEYVGYPSLDGDQLVDGEIDTLWISQNIPMRNRPTRHGNHLQINEILLEPHAGEAPLQWIEFYFKALPGGQGTDWKHYCVVNQNTNWKKYWMDEYTYRSVPEDNYIDRWNKGRDLDPDGTFLLLVSDRVEFERRWSLLGGYILDWREKQVGAFSLSKTGGFVAAMFYGYRLEPIVWYGTVAVQKFGRAGDEFDGHGPNWDGAPVPLPAPGHSMSRTEPGLVTSPSAAAFNRPDNPNPTPGGFEKGDEEWADVDLGPLNCRTTAFLGAGETEEMSVSDTLSLRASGQVLVNSEVIAYTSRDDANNKLLGLTRGVPPTEAADHPEDSLVQPYEHGVAMDAHLVGIVEWVRREVMGNNGRVVTPVMWDWMFSTHENPIHPDHPNWDDPVNGWAAYWTRYRSGSEYATATGLVTRHTYALPAAARVRHVMLVIHEMSDQGRAKMNQIHVLSDMAETLTGPDGEVAESIDGSLSGYFVRHILTTFGIAPDRITLTDEGTVLYRMTTAKGTYSQVLNDILRKTACQLIFDLDGSVEHRYNSLYPLSYIDDVGITWTRANARSVQLEAPERQNVSQVVLYARLGDGEDETTMEIRYPPKPLPLGEVMEVRDFVAGSVSEALLYAQQTFHQHNGPLSAIVIPVGPAEWARLGQRHLVTWDLDTEGTMLAGRNFAVEQVQWTIDLGDPIRGTGKSWHTSIALQEIIF